MYGIRNLLRYGIRPKVWMESRQRRVWHQAAGTLFYTRFARFHARLRRGSDLSPKGHSGAAPLQVPSRTLEANKKDTETVSFLFGARNGTLLLNFSRHTSPNLAHALKNPSVTAKKHSPNVFLNAGFKSLLIV